MLRVPSSASASQRSWVEQQAGLGYGRGLLVKPCRLCFVILALSSVGACADTKRFVLDVPDAAGGLGGQAGNAGAGGMSGSGGSAGGGMGGTMAGAGGTAGSGPLDSGTPPDAGADAGDAAADASP